MASNYPTSLDSFTDPTSGSSLASPSHSGQHIDLNDAVEKIETKLGIGSSPASSAANGAVLVANGSGTTTWTNSVGLWLVTSCTVSSSGGTTATASNGVVTIGNGNTEVTVSNAFSADYDNYLVKISGGGATNNVNTNFQLGTTTTNYSGGLMYVDHTTGAFATANDNAQSRFRYLWRHTQTTLFAHIQVGSPYLAENTFVQGTWVEALASGTYQGVQSSTTQFTSFKIYPESGSFTGGTIRVYGYRN